MNAVRAGAIATVFAVAACKGSPPTRTRAPTPTPSVASPVRAAVAATSTPVASPTAAVEATPLAPPAVVALRKGCGLDLPAAPPRIDLVPPALIAAAVIPSLDPVAMKAKVSSLPNGALVVEDCRGGTASARWHGEAAEPPGTVKVFRRQHLTDGKDVVWLTTARGVPGACWTEDGYGFLAIVALHAARISVVGVGRWKPECYDGDALRTETLGGETVYVESGWFDTGGGSTEQWDNVWGVGPGAELRIVGSFTTTEDRYDELTDTIIRSSATRVTYAGTEVLLEGMTEWTKTSDGSGGRKALRTKSWRDRYALRDGKLVPRPVAGGGSPLHERRQYQPPEPAPDDE